MEFVKRLFGSKEVETNVDETIFSASFEKEKQIVSALNMVGAGFEARGGSSLMLTEAVENGVDAIIKFNENKKKKIKGKIKVLIDKDNERILIIDNGTGFLQIKHVCEKPFDSLKELDITQTGKFARGLQGFRAFCENLYFITKRLPEDIPSNETDVIPANAGSSRLVVKLEFNSMSSKVKVKYIDKSKFDEYSNSEHGTICIYEKWKPGLFEKFNVNMLFKRLQHHFGELIRKGEIRILVESYEGKIAEIGPEQEKFQEVEPRDYSGFTPIVINPIPYDKNEKKGEISFNLHLCDRGRSDRWNQPYLLFQGRPVGDGFVSEIDEFAERPIWKHRFLTGYVTCDFCEINELRQGLKINDERDLLFKELLKIEKLLENKVKEHSKGLYELKLQRQVSELVKDLQLFFKSKNIFNFKIAKSMGFLSKENNEIEVVELAKSTGQDPNLEVKNPAGEGTEISGMEKFENTNVKKEEGGQEKTLNPDLGTHGDGHGQIKAGGLGEDAKVAELQDKDKEKGFKESEKGINKPTEQTQPHETGGNDKIKRKGMRHKPRGFGMVFQDDEFNEDLSWFDELNSVVIINSQHPRYLSRLEDESHFRDLMNYLAELYVWEITKLVHSKDDELQKGMKFLDYKFEYFEKMRRDQQEGVYANDSE
ncbi:hypothetical protein HYY70_07130 [Candidatus Woesearchaeota archaeon]|nr:hypothetical protein [Candidatus Woesearchaeota archaeon]